MNKPIPNKPKECSKGFNMSRVGEPSNRMRRICMDYDHEKKELLRKLVHEAGGALSDGLCEACYQHRMAVMDALEASEETKEMTVDPDGGPRRWRLDDVA